MWWLVKKLYTSSNLLRTLFKLTWQNLLPLHCLTRLFKTIDWSFAAVFVLETELLSEEVCVECRVFWFKSLPRDVSSFWDFVCLPLCVEILHPRWKMVIPQNIIRIRRDIIISINTRITDPTIIFIISPQRRGYCWEAKRPVIVVKTLPALQEVATGYNYFLADSTFHFSHSATGFF